LCAARPNRPTTNSDSAIMAADRPVSTGARRNAAALREVRTSGAPPVPSRTRSAVIQLDDAQAGLRRTSSRLCVANRTAVPDALMERNISKMPSVARSSRLPVGSSASTTSGSWTSARAMATRCCSPPDSSDRQLLRLGREADLREQPTDLRADHAGPRAGDFERERDVLRGRPVLQQPEVLEDVADLAAQQRDLAAADAGRRVAAHPHLAGSSAAPPCGSASGSSTCPRRCAPSGNRTRPCAARSDDVRQRSTLRGYSLRDVVQADHDVHCCWRACTCGEPRGQHESLEHRGRHPQCRGPPCPAPCRGPATCAGTAGRASR
jgi:hypothetical protein